jgi:ribosomal RNA-processing protein 17
VLKLLIQLREERKADLERHVEDINALLRPLQNLEGSEESQSETESAGANSWEGISAPPKVDREAEYVDEGRYTTVTVEAMEVSREGLHKADDNGQRNDAGGRNRQGDRAANEGDNRDEKRKWTREKPKDKADRPKKKNKKFRYESKGERKLARVKQKLRNKKQASARRAA